MCVNIYIIGSTYLHIVIGAVYGDGVYFATKASMSAKYCNPDVNGYRYIYLCYVLTGDYTNGRNGLKEPPPKDKDTLSWFHSVVDNKKSPSMFVIFNDYQAYPAFLITFK